MIVHWDQLPLAYGGAVRAHRPHFEHATETTYALLCCRLTPGDDRLDSSRGEHAEARLLESALWTKEIPEALGRVTALDSGPMVVTLAINRTPCPSCTGKLEDALRTLQWRYPLRFQRSRFVLACRGAYQGRVGKESGWYDNATTTGHLRRLEQVGWELAVLQMGPTLPPSGEALLQTLERMSGSPARATRLDA